VCEEPLRAGVGRFVAELRQDAALGVRLLRRGPGFAAVAILTLALGVGANTAIYSVLDAVLLRPLPYPQPDRVVMVSETLDNGNPNSTSGGAFLDWRGRQTQFDALTLTSPVSANLRRLNHQRLIDAAFHRDHAARFERQRHWVGHRAVVDRLDRAVFVTDRLPPARQVDDGQSAHAHADRPPQMVSILIGTTVHDPLGHPPHKVRIDFATVQIKYAGDTTHEWI
jgi:hypothetical protein